MSVTQLKSPAEIAIMDRANRVIRQILAELRETIRPGMTTLDIDRFAEDRIRRAGGVPAFKGYPHRGDGKDFPATVCASVNDEVVHGIPSDKVSLREGDIVSVDLGIHLDGYYGDSAETFAVGKIAPDARRLLQTTRDALERAVGMARPGNRVSDIGHAVQLHVESEGFSVVRHFVGHGIGSNLHEEPQVPNFGLPGRGPRLTPGMVLAIEPMVNAGGPDVILDAHDGWTARTRDGSLSAHFEWSVAVTENGPMVLGNPLPVTAAR
jgi:methionyl aminopeptidase